MPTPPPSDEDLTVCWQTTAPPISLTGGIYVPAVNFARAVLAKWGASSASIEEKRGAFVKGWDARDRHDTTWTVAASKRAFACDQVYPLPLPAPRPREVVGPSGSSYRVEGGTLMVRYSHLPKEWMPAHIVTTGDVPLVASLLATPTEDT